MNLLDLYMQTFLSRRDDFALQRNDGGYVRVGRPIQARDARDHLEGLHTLGSYVMNEHGLCSYVVFDADSENGLDTLQGVQSQLAAADIPSYLELSRRGGHLWVFLAATALASHVRTWLLPFCPAGIEFYPKQDEGKGYGSLIRLPFGVHRLSGKRYPFARWVQTGIIPVASSLRAALEWVASVQRAEPPMNCLLAPTPIPPNTRPKEESFSNPSQHTIHDAHPSIRAWCAGQDPYRVIGSSITLNSHGVGCCPFGWHHTDGHDSHASFKVYPPGVPGGYCWYCHVWQQGGSVFDFLRYYHHLDARTLWQHIQEEVQGW